MKLALALPFERSAGHHHHLFLLCRFPAGKTQGKLPHNPRNQGTLFPKKGPLSTVLRGGGVVIHTTVPLGDTQLMGEIMPPRVIETFLLEVAGKRAFSGIISSTVVEPDRMDENTGGPSFEEGEARRDEARDSIASIAGGQFTSREEFQGVNI